ncbi:MAG: hypothetical protein K2M46_11640 [Lachnospiraceae bacterium]|nr:hypothetical protein [Lachnospiraceae bacterium]
MSVMIYDVDFAESKICIGVSSEASFIRLWEQAIRECHITKLGNGIWLFRRDLEDIVMELEQIKIWAGNLSNTQDRNYLINKAEQVRQELWKQWQEHPEVERLWMG